MKNEAKELLCDITRWAIEANPCNKEIPNLPKKSHSSEKTKPKIMTAGDGKWCVLSTMGIGVGKSVNEAWINYLEDQIRVLHTRSKYWEGFAEVMWRK